MAIMLINKEGGGNMSDIKLNQIQSLKITKALMKEWTADQSQININYQPVMIVGQKEEKSLDTMINGMLRELHNTRRDQTH